jgi:hypothetical protein
MRADTLRQMYPAESGTADVENIRSQDPRSTREVGLDAISLVPAAVAMHTSAQSASPYREDHSFFDKIVSNSNENYQRRGRTTQLG